MNLREKYLELSKKEYKFSLIEEINALKDQCIQEGNKEYFYLCNILLCDLYIEHKNFEEALTIVLKDIRQFDTATFKNIYLSFLDRLIYIYITKRNYQVALRYLKEKEKYINRNDLDVLNRWYLEMAHVYAENGQNDKAEQFLKFILDHQPTSEIKSHVLNNLTKLYIDQKNIEAAKIALNQCLAMTNDHEGDIYCDYLLAKICVLDGKNNEALKIFDDIFHKENIDVMTLTIVNDYLELLITMNNLDKASLIMSKIFLFVNACDDLQIKKHFFKNRLKYFIEKNDSAGISVTLKEVEEIEEKILSNEQMILNANFEDDKNDIVEIYVNSIIEKVDILTNLTTMGLNQNNIRDLLMDFGKKTQSILRFDECVFVLFNKIEEKEFQLNNHVHCFKYSDKRLYEKKVEYENLRKTIVEIMISKNKALSIDLRSSELQIINIFSGKSYKEERTNFISVFPCLYKDDTFGCMIFNSKTYDLTNQNDTVLLKVAVKLLETTLITLFAQENMAFVNSTLEMLINDYNLGLIYKNENSIYLTDIAKKTLQLKHSIVNKTEFKKKIAHADLSKYEEATKSDLEYDVQYKFSLNNQIIPMREKGLPYKDTDGQTLFHIATITALNEMSLGYALGEKDLLRKMSELKAHSNIIEFKFSFVRIRGEIDEYINIKDDFGVEPFYLSDSTFIVILENEINQRILDRLTKNFDNRCSVIRYPRDIINIDEIITLSKILLDSGQKYSTDEIYRNYIKKVSVNNIIQEMLLNEMKIGIFKYMNFDNTPWNEIKVIVNGITDKENPRNFIENNQLDRFDNKFIETYLAKNIEGNNFFEISPTILDEIIDKNLMAKFDNVRFVISEYRTILPLVFEKLRDLKRKILIHVNMIETIDAYNFSSGLVEGIFIPNNIDISERQKVTKLANIFNLLLIVNNDNWDWLKKCYYTGQIEKIK